MSPFAMVDGIHLVQPVSKLSNGHCDSKSNVSGVSEQTKTAVDEQKHCNQAISAGEDLKPTQGSVLEEKKYAQGPWDSKRESIVNGPFNYLLEKPGKNIRTEFLRALNVWLQVEETSFQIVDRVISMLHNASLLIDDIQDSSQRRRGFPAAHHVFGSAQTINSANYVYFLAQQELFNLPKWPVAIRIFNEELLNLHRGQGMEVFWRDTFTVPTESQYLDMISKKTGALFCLAARLLQSLSTSTIDVLPLVYSLGLLFQICDDHKNLISDKMTDAKGYCEDLTEGKFSFPIIHAIRSSDKTNNDVLNILRLHTKDVQLKAHAVWYMRTQSKSMDYTSLVVQDLYEESQKLMKAIPLENKSLDTIMSKIVADCSSGG